jgi:hypothetical protein
LKPGWDRTLFAIKPSFYYIDVTQINFLTQTRDPNKANISFLTLDQFRVSLYKISNSHPTDQLPYKDLHGCKTHLKGLFGVLLIRTLPGFEVDHTAYKLKLR